MAHTRHISKEQKKLDNLANMRMEGEITKDEFIAYKDKLNVSIFKLEQRLSELREKLNEESKDVLPIMTFDQFEALIELSVDFTKPISDSGIVGQLVDKIVVNNGQEFTWYLNLFPHGDNEIKQYNEILCFKVEFEEAKEFRELRGAMLRQNQWSDLMIHLMI